LTLTRRQFSIALGTGFTGMALTRTNSSSAQSSGSPHMPLTLTPGTLIVASAYPDPPFDIIENGAASGFDIELMRAICAQLGLALRPVPYTGADFNGIFDGLAKRTCDAVISGTTITPERAAIVRFSEAYLEFNQGVAVTGG